MITCVSDAVKALPSSLVLFTRNATIYHHSNLGKGVVVVVKVVVVVERKAKDEVVLLTVLQNCNVAKSLLIEMHMAYIVCVSVRYMTSVG